MNIVFIYFYFFFAVNAFCEIECDLTCDPSQTLFSVQVEECEHPSCELSHENQHKYTKNCRSKTAQENCQAKFKHKTQFNYSYFQKFHLSQSKKAIQLYSKDFFFLNKKRYMFLRNLKIFLS